MAVQTRAKVAKLDATKYHGLDRETLIRIYRTCSSRGVLTTARFSSSAK